MTNSAIKTPLSEVERATLAYIRDQENKGERTNLYGLMDAFDAEKKEVCERVGKLHGHDLLICYNDASDPLSGVSRLGLSASGAYYFSGEQELEQKQDEEKDEDEVESSLVLALYNDGELLINFDGSQLVIPMQHVRELRNYLNNWNWKD
jgi:hypothetical protein